MPKIALFIDAGSPQFFSTPLQDQSNRPSFSFSSASVSIKNDIVTADGRVWNYLGQGVYNVAYKLSVMSGGDLVYKVPMNASANTTEAPDRAVRLWNLINHDLSPAATVLADGWVMPFIDGTHPSEEEICHKMIDIYTKTKRVVVDSIVSGNFIKQFGTGKVVCVDIGFALKFDIDHSKSQASLDGYFKTEDALETMTDVTFSKYPLISATTAALLYLAKNHPEIRDVSVLKNNEKLVSILHSAYEGLAEDVAIDAIVETTFMLPTTLVNEKKNTFLSIKTSLFGELNSARRLLEEETQGCSSKIDLVLEREKKGITCLLNRLELCSTQFRMFSVLMKHHKSNVTPFLLGLYFPICNSFIEQESHTPSFSPSGL